MHRAYSEHTLASGEKKGYYEKKDEHDYGMETQNGVELSIDFDFLFNYVDRNCLARLMMVTIGEDLYGVITDNNTLIAKKFFA